MNRAARLTGIALVGVVLLLVAAGVLLLESSWMREWLERQASQQLGREVEIVDHSIGWGAPVTLQLDEVRIANAEWAEEEPLARMYELSITLNVPALLQGRVELDHIAIDQPVLHLIRREDGSNNWDGIFEGDGSKEQGEDDEPLWPDTFNIGEGHLVYRDAALDLQLDAVFQTPGAGTKQGLSLEIWGDGRFREDDLEYQGRVHYLRTEDYLHVESMDGRVGNDLFSGALELDLDPNALFLEARLDMVELDLERWEGETADTSFPSPEWEHDLAEVLAALETYEAVLDIAVEELRYGDQVLHGLILQGRAGEGSVVIDRLEAQQRVEGEESPRALEAEGRIELHEERPVATVAARFEHFDLTAALAPLGLGEVGIVDGRLNARLQEGALLLEDTALDYRVPAWELALSVQAETREVDHSDRLAVRLVGDGAYEGQLVEYDLTVGPVDLVEAAANYPLVGELSTGDTLLQMDGRLVHPFALEAIEGDVRLEGPTPEEFAALFGVDLPTLPPYWLEAHLRYSDNVLSLDDAQGHIDELQLTGDLTVDLGGDVPHIATRIHAEELHLDRWVPDEAADEPSAWDDLGPGHDWDRDLAEVLQGLNGYDAEFDLVFDRLIHEDQILHEVTFEGRVDGPRLTILHFHAHQEEVGGQQGAMTLEGWAEERDQRMAASLSAQLDQVNLGMALNPLGLGGEGILSGRLNVEVVEGGLLFEDTALDYHAPQWDLALSLRASSVEGADPPGVHLVGDGTYEQEPFAYDLVIGALLGLADDETPYPVTGELSARDTRLYINGSVVRPFALESLEGDARLEGPTPAELAELTGISLPDLPSYEVTGYLRYSGDLLRLEGLEGSVGDSDVAGDLRLRLGERNHVWATLTSEWVDVDELLGFEPENGPDEAASSEQEPWIEDVERHQRIFSDHHWDLEALRNTDAVLDYRAAEVHSQYAPFNDLSLDLELEQGVMTVSPLRVGLGGGQVYAAWVLDAHQAAVVGELQLEISQVNLAALLDEAGLPDVAEDTLGIIGGHGEFDFRGRSMAELMAGLDGELKLAMSQGWLDIIAAELMPLNVANAFVEALSGEEQQVRLECSYVHFKADKGLVTLENFFMATEIAHFVGAGAMSLATEELDMAFEGHNREVTIFTANTPVKLKGPLSNPEVEVVTPELLARGVLSALGALVAPPLAILPWIDTGGGEDVGMGCEEALAQYHE